jgi:hypothetical protein
LFYGQEYHLCWWKFHCTWKEYVWYCRVFYKHQIGLVGWQSCSSVHILTIYLLSHNWEMIVEIFNFFYFDGTGAWTRGLTIARQMLYHLSYSINPFCVGYFEIWIHKLSLDWPWTMILLISVSWLARITSRSHQHLAKCSAIIVHLSISMYRSSSFFLFVL